MSKNFPRILVCPLDWGMGHATRCVPIIRELLKNEAKVIIGADGRSLEFLGNYFPELKIIRIPGMPIRYPSNGSMALHMAARVPGILKSIREEHLFLKSAIREYQIDAVISDNRFGLWSEQVISVYITHQVTVMPPSGWEFLKPVLRKIHSKVINRFDECWIPDYPGSENLSGKLGHCSVMPGNHFFIGPLSRFSGPEQVPDSAEQDHHAELLIMLSGPEPQRSILEKIMLQQLEGYRELKTILLRGLPGVKTAGKPFPHVLVLPHLPDKELARLIQNAGIILCRPGYSTLMDLHSLGKSAVLIPTPGQTEQEYLARYHSLSDSFYSIKQSGFVLPEAIQAARRLVPPDRQNRSHNLLEKRIRSLIGQFES